MTKLLLAFASLALVGCGNSTDCFNPPVPNCPTSSWPAGTMQQLFGTNLGGGSPSISIGGVGAQQVSGNSESVTFTISPSTPKGSQKLTLSHDDCSATCMVTIQ
jgi:hypothetical protein